MRPIKVYDMPSLFKLLHFNGKINPCMFHELVAPLGSESG